MEFIVTSAQEGMRLNDFLRREHRFSRKIISSMKFDGRILVNGTAQRTSYLLHEKDVVRVCFPETASENLLPQPISLNILYQDQDILAVDKPAGMAIHPSPGHGAGTLANAVAGYYKAQGLKTAVRILGRLDKDTSGVVLLSKHPLAHKILFETPLEKYYTAIVPGRLSPDSGEIDAPILETEKGLRRFVSPEGKHAVTRYRTVEVKKRYSLLELQLITGRTHQIRIHMAYLGHPLAGDLTYGGAPDLPRQALHAARLGFPHPLTGEKLCIAAPLPKDIKQFWEEQT